MLAQRLYAAHGGHDAADVMADWERLDTIPWMRAANESIEMLIDEPEREFQRQLQAVLNASESVIKPGSLSLESKAAREWREAKASDWMP
jgi:hypothetical protein